jgi:hypothetical protein
VQWPAILLSQNPCLPEAKSPTTLSTFCVLQRRSRPAFSKDSHASSVASHPIKGRVCGSAQLLRYRATPPRSLKYAGRGRANCCNRPNVITTAFCLSRIIKASLAVASLYQSEIAIACVKTTSLAERHHGALPSEKAEPACSTWGLSGM